MTPVAVYANASANSDRSTPICGTSAKAAISGPSIPPVGLASVTQPRPPAAIPASTTASIRLTVSVLATTNIDKKRNHTTSSAIKVPPIRAAQLNSRQLDQRRLPTSLVLTAVSTSAVARVREESH